MKKGTRVRPFLEPREPGHDNRDRPTHLPHTVDVGEIGRVSQVVQLETYPFDLQEVQHRSRSQLENHDKCGSPEGDGADHLFHAITRGQRAQLPAHSSFPSAPGRRYVALPPVGTGVWPAPSPRPMASREWQRR